MRKLQNSAGAESRAARRHLADVIRKLRSVGFWESPDLPALPLEAFWFHPEQQRVSYFGGYFRRSISFTVNWRLARKFSSMVSVHQ